MLHSLTQPPPFADVYGLFVWCRSAYMHSDSSPPLKKTTFLTKLLAVYVKLSGSKFHRIVFTFMHFQPLIVFLFRKSNTCMSLVPTLLVYFRQNHNNVFWNCYKIHKKRRTIIYKCSYIFHHRSLSVILIVPFHFSIALWWQVRCHATDSCINWFDVTMMD